MKNAKAKVATGATVVLLAGLTGIALSQGGGAPSKQVADKPVVHTKVIRRTIHVTKHAKPKQPVAAVPSGPASGSVSASGTYVATGSSGAAESAPVSTGSSGAGTAAVPVTTATSGGNGGYESEGAAEDFGGEIEHEGGGDD